MTTGDVDVGLNGQPEEALAAPLPVIRVDDLEAAFDAVSKAGGVIAKPIFAFPAGAASTSSTRREVSSQCGNQPRSRSPYSAVVGSIMLLT